MENIKLVKIVKAGEGNSRLDGKMACVIDCQGYKYLVASCDGGYFTWCIYPHTEDQWQIEDIYAADKGEAKNFGGSLISHLGAKPQSITINF